MLFDVNELPLTSNAVCGKYWWQQNDVDHFGLKEPIDFESSEKAQNVCLWHWLFQDRWPLKDVLTEAEKCLFSAVWTEYYEFQQGDWYNRIFAKRIEFGTVSEKSINDSCLLKFSLINNNKFGKVGQSGLEWIVLFRVVRFKFLYAENRIQQNNRMFYFKKLILALDSCLPIEYLAVLSSVFSSYCLFAA